MRRIKLVLAAAAVMMAMLGTVPVPATADDFDVRNCHDARGDNIRCTVVFDEDAFFTPLFDDNFCFFNFFGCGVPFGFDDGFRHDGGLFFGISQGIG